MLLEIKWAVLFAVCTLAWVGLEKACGFHDVRLAQQAWFTMLFVIPAVGLYYLALREKRARLGGTMEFRQAFFFGLGMSVILSLLSPVLQWVTHRYISPAYFANLIRLTVSRGNMTQQQAESFFNLRSYMMQSSSFALVSGVLTTAALAALMRTPPSQPTSAPQA